MKYNNETSLDHLAPWRVVIAGDWHGNRHWATTSIRRAHEVGADFIVHVGDFGYNFDRASKDEYVFNAPVQKALKKYDMNIVWIDGNHDNHAWLNGLPARPDGFVQTGSGGRVFWAPRGHRWNWSGFKFGALGGAFSVNASVLTEGLSIFAELEDVKQEDVDRLGTGKLDVLLTHDIPFGVPVHKFFTITDSREDSAVATRKKILEAVNNTRPEYVFSGHWHQRLQHDLVRDSDSGITKQHILDRETKNGNLVVFDLFDKSVSHISDFPNFSNIDK